MSFMLCRTVAACAAIFVATASLLAAPAVETTGDYAVVVSAETMKDPNWANVATALAKKHSAKTITYEDDVTSCLPDLRKMMPRHACFLARPREAGRDFVVDIHRLTRTLDGDPYTDVVWGILTGYRPADAMRIVREAGPLVIRKACAGTGINLGLFESGKWFSEGKAGEYGVKKPGGKAEKRNDGPTDSTQNIVAYLNRAQPDLFLTSGHATEHDWQLGYSYRNGQFVCGNGMLFGQDRRRRLFLIDSPNPKVYLAAGNCLIGHIEDTSSMALGWLGSGGAVQMVGYTVSTWFGAMGWGTRDLLMDLPGRHDLAEAFYFSNQDIVYRLHKEFPKTANVKLRRFNIETDKRLLGTCIAKLGYTKFNAQAKRHMGLLWDRDTVAFYGDPAYDARLATRELPVTTELVEADGKWTLTVRSKEACKFKKPLAMLLPKRIGPATVTEGKDLEPVITDDFIMLIGLTEMQTGQTKKLVFTVGQATTKPKPE